jgi:hypothetical protein
MPFLRQANTGIGIELGYCFKTLLDVNVSITEEPSARTPHTGDLCKGHQVTDVLLRRLVLKKTIK